MRRIVSSVFFILTSLSIWFIVPQQISSQILSFQLGPAIIGLTIGLAGFTIAGVAILLVVLVGFGRIYCSTICPLGFLQDLAIWLGKILRIKHEWNITQIKKLRIIRAGIFGITIVLLALGSAIVAGFLEPFAISSRIIFFLKMLFQGTVLGSISAILFIIISSFLILLLAAKKGRFFCSWLCPVGTILWGFSPISLFKFRINKTACNQCNICLTECKAGAILVKEKRIDQALCVGCFNCVSVCKTNAIKIGSEIVKTKSIVEMPENNSEIKSERRKFLWQFGSVMLVMSTPTGLLASNQLKDILSEKDHLQPVFPLGANELRRFKSKCTGCMLCASKCPAGIIIPSMGSIDSSPLLPALNFQNNYCLEDCVACSQVCPTGALQEVFPENKKTTKMASLELKLKECRIVAEGLECAICAEICPAHAIDMKLVAGQKYPIPVVIQEKCNGCGKCQYRCPVKKKEEIFRFNS